VQINGVVWSQTTIGNTVYATGSFTSARPAGSPQGTNESPANNILAFDIRTGERVAAFNASLNAQGLVIKASPDGSRVYVGGDFTEVNGVARGRVAALDATTGALIQGFAPDVSNTVQAMAVTNQAVYVGGAFFQANGFTRTRLAAFAPSGTLLSWKPSADDENVLSMVASPDQSRIVLGGKFSTLNGVAAKGLGAVDAQSGQTLPFAANLKINNSGVKAGITGLQSDGTRVFGTGYVFGPGGNLEGAFSADPNTGEIVWIEDCHGDSYDVFAVGRSVLVATHAHYCNNIEAWPQNTASGWSFARAMSFTYEPTQTIAKDQVNYFNWAGNPAPSAEDFWPAFDAGTITGQSQAAWSITGNSQYVSFGGEFPRVNSAAQQGLVRFAIRSAAPKKMKPIFEDALRPVLTPVGPGEVRVQWKGTWDRDNTNLTYKLIRDDKRSTPIAQFTVPSKWWDRPALGYTDRGLTPGNTHKYRVQILDGDGNLTESYSQTITLPLAGESPATDYASAVVADGARNYWRMGAGEGTLAADYAGGSWLTWGSGVTAALDGAVPGEALGASTFSGASTALGYPQDRIAAPKSFSVEAWIKTTSTAGGRIVGFSDRQSGSSASNYRDRQLYVGTNGRVYFGINPQTGRKTIGSPFAVNDGTWHHVVGTMDTTNGTALYVDGIRVAQDPSAKDFRFYSGYWRVGADAMSGWPNSGTQQGMVGSIDDVAVYDRALTKAQVDSHWTKAGRPSKLPPTPTDAYGTTVMEKNPGLYWRFDEASGTAVVDSTGNGQNARLDNGPLLGAAGLPATGTTAAAFDGANDLGVSTVSTFSPSHFTAETWLKTSSTKGGKVFGFGNTASGLSSTYDRHVWMTAAGRLNFGIYNGAQATITTTESFNDGQWHHVVAQLGTDGTKLWVDGVLRGQSAASNPTTYYGYWRVGGDRVWDTSSLYLNGTIDEFAVYGRVLTKAEIRENLLAGGGTMPNDPPVASFTATGQKLAVSVDASGSSDPDGSVASYGWDWGDGEQGTGAIASHTYARAGTYTVTLTVTDDDGAASTKSEFVTVVANQAPVAAVESSVSKLVVSVDASGSSDPDGSVASYGWDWGDGEQGTGAIASHTYAQAGTYTVTLTVTDNDGGTGTSTAEVTVIAPPLIASDSFQRAATGGLGSADVGGAWTPVGSTSRLSVGLGSAAFRHDAPGNQDEANLTSVSTSSADLTVSLWADEAATGGGLFTSISARRLDPLNRYDARVRFATGDKVGVTLTALKGSSTVTGLSGEVTLPGTYPAGTRLSVRLQTFGSSPTTIRVKVWAAGSVEPAAWLIERTDSHPALQVAGQIGLRTYLSAAATVVPVSVRFDDLRVVAVKP
jgi:PKD repeat protein